VRSFISILSELTARRQGSTGNPRKQLRHRAASDPDSGECWCFLTAAGGTLLFVLLCFGVHLLTSGVMPSATEKLVDGMLDMAKIGFGAVVGLLCGQTLRNGASLE
jgi:hypothetical protein